METTFWPRARAQRAFCEAEILARAAALIVRRPRFTPVLFNPLSALIAVSSAFTCCAALSRSAFNSSIMSMYSSPGEDCTGYKVHCMPVFSEPKNEKGQRTVLLTRRRSLSDLPGKGFVACQND